MSIDTDVQTESSPVETVNAESSPAVATVTSDSSPEKPASMLDAVQKALESKAEASVEEEVTTDKPPADAGAKEGETAPEQKPEAKTELSVELKDYAKEPFGKHPRFREVLADLKETRERAVKAEEALTARAGEFEASAKTVEEFGKFRSAVHTAGLTAPEISEGFTIMALMKSDPARALEMLTTKVADLQALVGEVLPQDLADKVERGLIDEETARAVSRERAARTLELNRTKEQTAVQQNEFATRQHQNVMSAITAWENQWKASDPDYAKKQSFVQSELVRLAQTEGVPTTPEAGVKLVERAKQAVETQLAALLPPRPAVKHNSGRDTNPAVVAKPKTLLEAVSQAAAL